MILVAAYLGNGFSFDGGEQLEADALLDESVSKVEHKLWNRVGRLLVLVKLIQERSLAVKEPNLLRQ